MDTAHWLAAKGAGLCPPWGSESPCDPQTHFWPMEGDGQILHAPRPGPEVRYDAMGIMPLHSVVRP